MHATVIVPTLNEAANVHKLVERLDAALDGWAAEILFVDDSTDETPHVIEQVGAQARIPVRLIHRTHPTGGLAGAVAEGLAASSSEWCVVMDGDLQHPPEVIPALLAAGSEQRADVVVASRHIRGGSSDGLSGRTRELVSRSATLVTRAMFPTRLRDCTDPMTGFFAIRRNSIDLESLRPRGFKILLEILARNDLTLVEEPFVFAERDAGRSKADYRQGIRFLAQLASLRFGRVSGFAVIGALGAVANLAIMAGLQAIGIWYLVAAIVAAIVTIVGNFALQERYVFNDLRAEGRPLSVRFAQSFAFNGAETLLRTVLLWAVVVATALPSIPVQAALLGAGFFLRFLYHSRIVYRPGSAAAAGSDVLTTAALIADPDGVAAAGHPLRGSSESS